MKNLSLDFQESIKDYYNAISDMIGISEIPLNNSKLIELEKLKEEKDLIISANKEFFDSVDTVLNIENSYYDFINGCISEKEFSNICSVAHSLSKSWNFDIEDIGLSVCIEPLIVDDENYGVIGFCSVEIFKKDVCLMNMSPIINSSILHQGVPFSMNNIYCSKSVTKDGREYLDVLNHGYRIKFNLI